MHILPVIIYGKQANAVGIVSLALSLSLPPFPVGRSAQRFLQHLPKNWLKGDMR